MEQSKKLYSLLGELPPSKLPVKAEIIEEKEYPKFIMEYILLDCNGLEKVPAFMAIPKVRSGKVPAILYNHSHGGRHHVGKNELIEGAPYIYKPWINDIIDNGYAVLAIDHWGFGERATRTESSIFKEFLWNGRVMWGMMVYDSLRALDYLCSRNDVDKNRIATLGMSMGSTMAWYAAALDSRIKVCIDICCLTDFDSLIKHNGLDCHGIYYYVPKLLKYFDTASINSLIAPRAHLATAGIFDRLTPEDGLNKIDNVLKKKYRDLGAADNWKLLKFNLKHEENAEMRSAILSFMKEKIC